MNDNKQVYRSFSEFYPYYLSEHQNSTCRRLHFVGSLSVISLLLYVLIKQDWVWLWALPVLGYGFAWVGHFFYEHNKPATFQHPWYSFLGDWVMMWQILTGKIKF